MERRDKGLYNGCNMRLTWVLPRAASLAYLPRLSKQAKLRLQWFDYYFSHDRNAFLTCRRYGISRKTFYKWLRRYNKYSLATLEDQDRIPKRRRSRETTGLEELRIVNLRKKYLRYMARRS